MESLRQRRRRPKTKKALLTQGGWGEYVIDEAEYAQLVRLFVSIKNQPSMRKLLGSLFTNRELADVIRRLMIAKHIVKGMSYEQIHNYTQASKPTISLVKKALYHNPELVSALSHATNWQTPETKVFISRLKRGK